MTQTSSIPQQPLPPTYVSLRELHAERENFKVDPPFQRKQVWSIRTCQALVDTILLGDPIPPLEGYTEYEDGKRITIIVDGHQRTAALLQFMDGKFKTWTSAIKRQAEPNSSPPVEPGKYFDELSLVARNHLLDYHLQINLIRKVSDEQIVTRFLRVQNHVPLNPAEKLNAYRSKAKEAAHRVEQHEIWSDFYEGRTKRYQALQGGFSVLAIELAAPDGMVEIQSTALLNNLASGRRDKEITDTLVDTILSRLDIVTHVFYGTHFTVQAAIVPMYQSIMFLEQSGYVIQQKDKGRMTKWFMKLMEASKSAASMPKYNQPIQLLTHKRNQKAFWEKHRSAVFALFGIKIELF